MFVQAGLRTLHEAGPEVKRAISGNLEELADVELETNTRRNMPFFGSVIQVGHRIVKFRVPLLLGVPYLNPLVSWVESNQQTM